MHTRTHIHIRNESHVYTYVHTRKHIHTSNEGLAGPSGELVPVVLELVGKHGRALPQVTRQSLYAYRE